LIIIKSKEEQDIMRQGGKILAQILAALKKAAKPDIKKKELDELANRLCRDYQVEPSFKGYGGYPNSVCVSVNDEVVHGLPNNEILNIGDLVKLDMGVKYRGFHTDSALSFVCGNFQDRQKDHLIKTCEQSFYSGIGVIKDGIHLGDVSAEIQKTAEKEGYGVIRMLVGHGIGQNVHEDPHIPNYGNSNTGPMLKTGMVLAIEPMITFDGSIDVVLDDDNWTYKSRTGTLCAHYEHTVLVTDNGYEILTK